MCELDCFRPLVSPNKVRKLDWRLPCDETSQKIKTFFQSVQLIHHSLVLPERMARETKRSKGILLKRIQSVEKSRYNSLICEAECAAIVQEQCVFAMYLQRCCWPSRTRRYALWRRWWFGRFVKLWH